MGVGVKSLSLIVGEIVVKYLYKLVWFDNISIELANYCVVGFNAETNIRSIIRTKLMIVDSLN